MKRVLSTIVLGCCCSSSVFSQNLIDNYLSGTPTYTVIANASQSVNQPRDLDFKPFTNELWLINRGGSNGGSNVIIYNAGQQNQTTQYRMDTHAGHFMIYPSAIAFGDDGEFSTTQEIKNTASPASTFMGPALWSGDTSIFARVFQNNWVNGKPLGSHLDMIHQSPFSMGVAHDSGSMYWVFDGHNGNLCKYDFGDDHSPGYDDHSNGRIWRYTDVPLTRTVNVPGHMILDKGTGWLYIIDAGQKKLKRVNTATGTVSGTLSAPATAGEPLMGYWAMSGTTVEVLDSFLTQPCGIDLYNGRLIVGDYDNGDIHVYDITGTTPVHLGVIATGQAGMMGMKIGTDGRIWFVNYTQNTVMRIDPSTVVNDDVAVLEITSPAVNNTEAHFYHTGFNECVASITPAVTIKNTGANTLTSATISYSIDNGSAVAFNWTGSLAPGATASVTLPAGTSPAGEHKLTVEATDPNGVADANPANNKVMGSFRMHSAVAGFPFSEHFSTPTFPAAGWFYLGHNFHNEVTHQATFGHAAPGSIKMNNYTGPEDIQGQRDYILLPRIDFSNATASANITFSLAHSQYDLNTSDRLTIYASTDCGDTWTTVYDKSGTALATASATTAAYNSPASTDWRVESASLGAFAGQQDVLLQMKLTSGFGNNLFIDDITVSNTLDVPGQELPQFSIYPNPATDRITVKATKSFSDDVTLQVSDMAGKLVRSMTITQGVQQIDIDVASLVNGTYVLSIKSGDAVSQEKITIMK